MLSPSPSQGCHFETSSQALVELEDGERGCPGCGITLEPQDWSDSLILFCPECGECLGAPKPWRPSRQAAIVTSRSNGPGEGEISGWCHAAIGLAFASTLVIPGLNPSLRLAGALLGAALLIQGTITIRAAAQRRQPRRKASNLRLPEDLPARMYELGSLKAVFQTADIRGSLAVLAVGVAGELALLHWLKQGADQLKLLAAALLGPSLVVYFLCRVMRVPFRRRHVLIFAAGLVSIRGQRVEIYLWDRIDQLSYDADSVDEHVLEIRFKFGLRPLRFGSSHFGNLKQVWLRLQQERHNRAPSPGAEPGSAVLRGSD